MRAKLQNHNIEKFSIKNWKLLIWPKKLINNNNAKNNIFPQKVKMWSVFSDTALINGNFYIKMLAQFEHIFEKKIIVKVLVLRVIRYQFEK